MRMPFHCSHGKDTRSCRNVLAPSAAAAAASSSSPFSSVLLFFGRSCHLFPLDTLSATGMNDCKFDGWKMERNVDFA